MMNDKVYNLRNEAKDVSEKLQQLMNEHRDILPNADIQSFIETYWILRSVVRFCNEVIGDEQATDTES